MNELLISVVVPAHNEEESIADVVHEVATEVGALGDFEMIVVDDASTDGTGAVLARLSRQYEWLRVEQLATNAGHGAAVAAGMRLAQAPWVFQLDADAQFVVADIAALWARRDDGDVVIGIRARRQDAPGRIVLSKVAARFTGAIAGQRLHDVNSPFRIFRRSLWDVVEDIVGPAPHIPSVSTCVVAARLGVPIVEVPIRHLPRPHGRSTLNLRRLAPLLVRGVSEVLSAVVATRPMPVTELVGPNKTRG